MNRPAFQIRARNWRRTAFVGWAVPLLVLASCDRVIGLQQGYYLTAAAAGVGGDGLGGELAGTGNSAGANAQGGTRAATGGGGIAGSSEASGGSAIGVAGSGGGGAPPIGGAGASGGGAIDHPLCADQPLTAQSTWLPTASSADAKYPPAAAIDGSATRWSTGKPQVGGEWLQIDFGTSVGIRRINLQQGTIYSNDYPRRYAVHVSDATKDLSGPVLASGVGASGVTTTIILPQVFFGRYLLIEQLDTSLSWWSVEEVEVSCYDG